MAMAEPSNILTFASYNECLDAIRTFEIESKSRFCVWKSTKGFGSHDVKTVKKILFEDKSSTTIGAQTFNGVPYAVLGQKRLDCQFGKDRKLKRKMKKKAAKNCKDHNYQKGEKFVTQSTKKMGCPAKVVMRELVRFPSYKVESSPTKSLRENINDEIIGRIHAGHVFDWQPQYVLCLPSPEAHNGHPVNQCGVPEPVDNLISAKIKELTCAGVKTVSDMKLHLKQYVREITDVLPSPNNRRFYPTDKIIGNHMYTAHEVRTSEDQQHVQEKSSQNFLLVIQTAAQKRLLRLYGDMVLMDATYKTTLYDIPLFFLVVKTNVDYQVVATFMPERESAGAIQEALGIIKGNNETWRPTYFMVDFCDAEILAIENEFRYECK